MNLFESVNKIVQDEAQTTMALGSLFMVIRFSMNADRFSSIQSAIPDVDQWMKESGSGETARTGELLAITDPKNVMDRLTSFGLNEAQVHSVAHVIADQLSDALDEDTLGALTARIPILAQATA